MTASASGRLVITIVWDGLRPDFVTPQVTPVLHARATEGVWFEASHCAYPSETRVNAAALATGCYPGRTGITGNSLYVPGFNPDGTGRVANTGDYTQLARLAALDAPLLRAPWVAQGQGIDRAGGVMVVASSGSPGSALVHWWLTDPDHTAHSVGLGAPETVQSLRENDARLAALLDALDHLRLTSQTDVILTADHGFSTLAPPPTPRAGPPRSLDAELFAAGLLEALHADDVVTTGAAGGSISLHQRATRRAPAIVRWLQERPWIGPIFAHDRGPAAGTPGTLPLSLVWNGHVGPRAPDIKFSRNWTAAPNAAGIPGTTLGTGSASATHGSASPYYMRTSLFAWGPRFHRQRRTSLPAGIVDIAPTVRHLLDLPAEPTDGRILHEALSPTPAHEPATAEPLTQAVHEATAEWPGGGYRQRVHLSTVGATTYLDRADVEHRTGPLPPEAVRATMNDG